MEADVKFSEEGQKKDTEDLLIAAASKQRLDVAQSVSCLKLVGVGHKKVSGCGGDGGGGSTTLLTKQNNYGFLVFFFIYFI